MPARVGDRLARSRRAARTLRAARIGGGDVGQCRHVTTGALACGSVTGNAGSDVGVQLCGRRASHEVVSSATTASGCSLAHCCAGTAVGEAAAAVLVDVARSGRSRSAGDVAAEARSRSPHCTASDTWASAGFRGRPRRSRPLPVASAVESPATRIRTGRRLGPAWTVVRHARCVGGTVGRRSGTAATVVDARTAAQRPVSSTAWSTGPPPSVGASPRPPAVRAQRKRHERCRRRACRSPPPRRRRCPTVWTLPARRHHETVATTRRVAARPMTTSVRRAGSVLGDADRPLDEDVGRPSVDAAVIATLDGRTAAGTAGPTAGGRAGRTPASGRGRRRS